MRIFINLLVFAAALVLSPALATGQTVRTGETTAEVPALTEFHSVIFEIWHTAWPAKDIQKLVALLPSVEKGVQAIAAAELPGILREKKAAWVERVGGLQSIAAAYRAAVDGKKDRELLDAAEKLHSQYEQLVRTVRPVLTQLDQFHAVLYPLYHYYMPGDSVDQMRQSAAALNEKMAVLNKATLPERMKARQPGFDAARKALARAVEDLSSAAAHGDLSALKKAGERVHDEYLRVERVLE